MRGCWQKVTPQKGKGFAFAPVSCVSAVASWCRWARLIPYVQYKMVKLAASILIILASIIFTANPASAQTSTTPQRLDIEANTTRVRGGDYIRFTINSISQYNENHPHLPVDTPVAVELSGDISQWTYKGSTANLINPPSPLILILEWPTSRTKRITFDVRVADNPQSHEIIATVLNGTGYSHSPSFYRERVQVIAPLVQIPARPAQPLDLLANTTRVNGGENITFTINSLRVIPASENHTFIAPNTTINLELQGDIIEYTYDGNTFPLFNNPSTIHLRWPANTDYITFHARVADPPSYPEITATLLPDPDDNYDVLSETRRRMVQVNPATIGITATLTLTPTTNRVDEGDEVTLTLAITQPQPESFSVSYATIADTAIAGSDYTATNTSVEFLANETEKTITIQTLNNAIDVVDDLVFRLVANTTLAGVNLTANATITIADDDNNFALSLAPTSVNVPEGDPINLTLTLSNPLASPFYVTYMTSDGTAIAGSDYTAANASVVFAAGETEKTITLMTLADDVYSDGAPLQFTLAVNATRNGSVVMDSATIYVTENGVPPQLSLAANDTKVNAGENVTFTITGDKQSATARQVAVDISGGATLIFNGSDTISHGSHNSHNATTRIQLTLPPAATTASFIVTADNTSTQTAIPDIVASLVASAGYTLNPVLHSASVRVRQTARKVVAPDPIVPTIDNYTLNFDAAAYSVVEGEGVLITFTITPPPPSPTTLYYTLTDGTAMAGVDYEGAMNMSVAFPPASNTQTIEVATMPDLLAPLDDAHRRVNFTITANVVVDGQNLTGTRVITIHDEDEMPVLSLRAPPSVLVGHNATVYIESNRTMPPEDRRVMVEINGTAVEAIYSLQGAITLAGHSPSPITNTVILPKEKLHTNFVVQAVNGDDHSDNLTPIVVRLLNGTGYAVHPDPKRQVAVIHVQQGSNFSLPDLNTAILPQVVAVLLDETASTIAARSRAFSQDNAGNRDNPAWQRLTIGGDNIRDFAEAYARGEAQREANENPWDAPSTSRLTQLPDPRLLRFNLALHKRGSGGDGFALWGHGFTRSIAGNYSGIDFDGDVPGSMFGIETTMRQRLLLGIGFSDIAAKFDYASQNTTTPTPTTGIHETDLTGYHPYIAWRLRGGGHVWATLGVTEGEVTIRQNTLPTHHSEVEAETASLGFSTSPHTRRQADGSAIALNFYGDASYAAITATPTRNFAEAPALDLSVARVRIGGRISKHSVLDRGGVFRQSLDLAIRHDSGDILEGGAVEIGASTSLALRSGLTIDLSVRTLLFHEEKLDEFGLRGRLAWSAPHAGGRGLQLVLAPEWGNSESQSDALLDSGIGAYRYYADSDGDGDNDETRYAFDVRYGIPVFRGGLLTPFISGDASDIAGATYGSVFSYGDFAAGIEAGAGDEGKAFSRYSRDF